MKSSILALAIATTMAGLTLPVMATDVISSTVNVSTPAKQLTSDEWRTMSLAGNRILKQTGDALTALADKKDDAAAANIEQGLKLAEIINEALPESTVKTEIKGEKLSYTESESVKPTFIPIYREYDTIDVLSAVSAQKAAKGKQASSAGVPDVTYAGFDYTGVQLDLAMAKRDLQSAQDLIKKGDTTAATTALQEILSTGVSFQFSTMDEPLVRAMDNLRLAEAEITSKDPGQAKIALAGASDALKNYEKMTGDTRSKEVKQLYTELDDEQKSIDTEKPETITPKVSGWWGRVHSWLKL
jgi:hypothetical protein